MVLSVWEIIGQADGGLSVLRTFRLLRVLKLVRFLPALRRQLVVLMKTMDNVATFCMLLMLFIFTFRYNTCKLSSLCIFSHRKYTFSIVIIGISTTKCIHLKIISAFSYFSAVYWECICLVVNSVFAQRMETPSLTERTLTLYSGPS